MHGRAQNPVETKTPEPLAYRINDASRALGVGRTKLYELAAQGRLKLVQDWRPHSGASGLAPQAPSGSRLRWYAPGDRGRSLRDASTNRCPAK